MRLFFFVVRCNIFLIKNVIIMYITINNMTTRRNLTVLLNAILNEMEQEASSKLIAVQGTQCPFVRYDLWNANSKYIDADYFPFNVIVEATFEIYMGFETAIDGDLWYEDPRGVKITMVKLVLPNDESIDITESLKDGLTLVPYNCNNL